MELAIPQPATLKDKRRIIRSLKDRLRRLNVAVAEVDRLQSSRWAVLGLSCVAGDRVQAERIVSSVERMLEATAGDMLGDWWVEWVEDWSGVR